MSNVRGFLFKNKITQTCLKICNNKIKYELNKYCVLQIYWWWVWGIYAK